MLNVPMTNKETMKHFLDSMKLRSRTILGDDAVIRCRYKDRIDNLLLWEGLYQEFKKTFKEKEMDINMAMDLLEISVTIIEANFPYLDSSSMKAKTDEIRRKIKHIESIIKGSSPDGELYDEEKHIKTRELLKNYGNDKKGKKEKEA